jgi:tetratricopeptide (TPR) repeat protein
MHKESADRYLTSPCWLRTPSAMLVCGLLLVGAANGGQDSTWDAAVDRAAALQRQGHYAEAEASYLAAYASLNRAPDADVRAAHVAGGLCSLYAQTWRPADAERYCLHALAVDEAHGGEVVRVIRFQALHSLFMANMQTQNISRARQWAGRLAALLSSDNSAPPCFRGLPPYDRGTLDLVGGRTAAAKREFLQARDIFRTCADHANLLAATLSNLCLISLRERDYGEAESEAGEAIGLLERRFGPGHPEIAGYLENLATVYLRTQRAAAAEPLLQQALSIATAGYGPEDISVRNILVTYASVLKSLKRRGEARAMEHRASTITEHLVAAGSGRLLIDTSVIGRAQ